MGYSRSRLSVLLRVLLGGVFIVAVYILTFHLSVSSLFTRSSFPRFNIPVRIFDIGYQKNIYPSIVSDRASPNDIVIHSVHFDNRSRDGHHNATVFIMEVTSEVLNYNLISGCGIDNFRADYFKIRDCSLNVWLRKYNKFESEGHTHWCSMVDCYGLPVRNNSKPLLFYKAISTHHIKRGKWGGFANQVNRMISITPPKPLLIPAKKLKTSSKYPFTISVCRGPVFGTPPLLNEWLRYQKTIGVDHVFLIVEESYVHNGGLETPEISKLIQEEFLSYTVWGNPSDDVRTYYRSQMGATQACLYYMLGVSDYVFIADTDDFFTPATPHKSLHYYVDRWCHHNSSCGALNLRWIQRHVECGLKDKIPEDGNVTSVLASDAKHEVDVNGFVNYKTVHRTSAALDIQVHKHCVFLPGYGHVQLPENLAYVSHIREHKVSEGTRCAKTFQGLNIHVRCLC